MQSGLFLAAGEIEVRLQLQGVASKKIRQCELPVGRLDVRTNVNHGCTTGTPYRNVDL